MLALTARIARAAPAAGRPARLARMVTLLVLAAFAAQAFLPGIALAKAPALAIVAADTPLLVAPQADAQVVRTLRAGDEVELTGGTAIGFLAVIFRGDRGWVAASDLAISGNVGIPLAEAPNGARILAAPLRDAAVLGRVPPGGVVLLTGAQVGTFVAGSYEGVGGWIEESDLTLPYDADGGGY
jgi:hypothetical protein